MPCIFLQTELRYNHSVTSDQAAIETEEQLVAELEHLGVAIFSPESPDEQRTRYPYNLDRIVYSTG